MMKVVLMVVMTAVGDGILRKRISCSLKVDRTEGEASRNSEML